MLAHKYAARFVAQFHRELTEYGIRVATKPVELLTYDINAHRWFQVTFALSHSTDDDIGLAVTQLRRHVIDEGYKQLTFYPLPADSPVADQWCCNDKTWGIARATVIWEPDRRSYIVTIDCMVDKP